MVDLVSPREDQQQAEGLLAQQAPLSQTPEAQVDDEERRYADIIKSRIDQEEDQLRASLFSSVDSNPDQEAELDAISQRSGLPRDTVERNIARVVKEQRTKDLQEAARVSPILAKQLSDPNFARIAHDDVERLSGMEGLLTRGADFGRALIGQGVGDPLGRAVSGVGELYGIASKNFEAALDAILPNSVMSTLRGAIPEEVAPYIAPYDLLTGAGTGIKDISKQIAPPQERQNFATDVVAGVGQLGTQIYMHLVFGPLASTAMMSGQGADIMAENTAEDDATQAAKDTAIIAGAGITALTERLGLDAILNRVPPAVRNRTLRFIADKAAAGGIEFAQEVVEGLLHDLARRALTNPEAEILEGALYEGSVAGVSAAIVRTALGANRFAKDRAQQDFITALGDNAKASKLRERLPEKFRQLVEKMNEQGPVKNIYIPAEQFQTYYQSQGVNPEQKANELGALNYVEAVAAGTDIVIPIAQFTSKIAPSDDLQGLFQDVKISQGDLTIREYAEFQANEQQNMQEILRQAQEVAGEINTTELQDIKDAMLNNLLEVGYEQRTADAYATVYAKTISNLAERAGVAPTELHQRYDLSVTRPLPEVMNRQKQGGFDLNPVLDFMRQQVNITPEADIQAEIDAELTRLEGLEITPEVELELDAVEQRMQALAAGELTIDPQQIDQVLADLGITPEDISTIQDFLDQIGVDLTQITDNAEVMQLIQQATDSPEVQQLLAEAPRLFQALQGEAEVQPAESGTVQMMAVHSLSADNLKFADEMGGLAVPSIGVVTEEAGGVDGFGSITLIGGPSLADPTQVPVFSADAYTARFPRPEYDLIPERIIDPIVQELAPFNALFQDTLDYDIGIEFRDSGNAQKAVSDLVSSVAFQAKVLADNGIDAQPVYSVQRDGRNLKPEFLEEIRPLYTIVEQQRNDGITESPERTELIQRTGESLRQVYEAAGVSDVITNRIIGDLNDNIIRTLESSYRDLAAGPRVDRYATKDQILALLQENNLLAEVQNQATQIVQSVAGEPFLRVGRRKVPYTLENIAKVMASDSKVKGREQTMTFGTGQARAEAAVRFSDIEQMREMAKESIRDPEEYTVAKQETEQTIGNYREMMLNYQHDTNDTWAASDASMRVIARFGTQKDQTPEKMRELMTSEGFPGDQVSDSDVQFAVDAAMQFFDAPVPYFEAKPNRIVNLDEFAGAVVPVGTSQETLDILAKNNIAVREVDPDQRIEATRQFAAELQAEGQQVLFQSAEAQQFPIQQTVELGEFRTGQPVTFDFVHNTESATEALGLPKAGDRFQRDLEPSGRYLNQVADAATVDTTGTLIAGTITFNNPLVIDATNWKQDLSGFYGLTGRNLSQALIDAGYDGVVTIEPEVNGRPAYTSEILDLTTFEPARAMYQSDSLQGKRGFIQFGKDRNFNITLLDKADLSTFLHETGHFYLEVLGDLATAQGASQQLADDYATVLKFLGLESRDQLTLDGKKPGSKEYQRAVNAHEKFARANEAYLMEGKAPSADLRSLFQRFRQWLKVIYRQIESLDVTLNPQVREVFDRIYATDAEIEAAKSEMSMEPIFLDAETAGMTEQEFELYKETVRQASESGKEALQQKLMQEMMRERKAWWKEESTKVREEVAQRIDQEPVRIAFEDLTSGEMKLNKDELIEQFGPEYIKRLPRKLQRVYTTGEGMPLEVVARNYGFPTGAKLVEALIAMPKRDEAIKAETDRIMRERHGDLLTDGSIYDEAKIALHTTQREKVLATELRALRRKQREVRPFVQAERDRAREERRQARAATEMPPMESFRAAAKGMIEQTAIRDLEPQRHLNAQRKYNKKAFTLMSQGKFAEAADAKQKEILNHFMYIEARKARERADKIARYMAKFAKKETRQRIGKASQDYLENIDAILDSYEFKRVPLRTINRREMLLAFVAKQEAEGNPVNIPLDVLEDSRQINYRRLSSGELEAVYESVKNIENLARLKNKLTLLAEKRTLDEVAGEAIALVQSKAKDGKKKKIEEEAAGEQLKRWAKGFMLMHKKFATFFRQMDGWKDDGVMWNLFVKPVNAAADFEAKSRSEATKKLREIFKVYRGTNMQKKVYIPAMGQSVTLQTRLMVALNWGREENRQRLRDGNGLTDAEIEGIFETLTEADWQFVQNIWDYIDSYWPQISEQYTKLYGVAPQKSDNAPFRTKYGVMKGGYFPIKYDAKKSTTAQAHTVEEVSNMMKSGAYVRSQTKNGFTKEVMENLDRALLLDFGTIYTHVAEVIHDLALREYLLDTNKLLNHKVNGTTLKDTINEVYGDQTYREITDTIKDIAIGDIQNLSALEAAMAHLRSGVSIVGMGWSLMTGLMQPMGITQSFVRIGPKWVAKGMARWGMDAIGLKNSGKFIYEKSKFMETRNLTQNREINEIRNQIQRQGKFPIARETWGVINDSYFVLITQLQKVVDFPTWLGAYEKALANGADDTKAVALADQAVIDAQGGGAVKDLASVQRGGQLQKLWTNFYSYFNTTFNLTLESFGKTKFKDPIDIGRLAVDMIMLYSIPAFLTVALKEAINVIMGGEEKDEEEIIDTLIKEHLTYMMGTMVGLREMSSVVEPEFGYSGPAGARLFAEMTKLSQQIGQGELDEGLRKRAIGTAGMILHFPAGQVNRTIEGIYALEEGEADSPAVLIFGPPRD